VNQGLWGVIGRAYWLTDLQSEQGKLFVQYHIASMEEWKLWSFEAFFALGLYRYPRRGHEMCCWIVLLYQILNRSWKKPGEDISKQE
jgi:hypothetical protein